MTDTRTALIAENRAARHHYHLGDDLEVGIVLYGPEVKTARAGQVNIADSYVNVEGGELWLINAYFAPYDKARNDGYEERRRRKLLASKREISKLWQEIGRRGMTVVPVRMYFNEQGRIKLRISVAKGKNAADKRQSDATRDWNRQKQRLLKTNI